MECGWTSGSFFYHLTKLLYHDVAVVLQHWDVFVTVMILLGGAILNNSAVEMPPRTGAILGDGLADLWCELQLREKIASGRELAKTDSRKINWPENSWYS